jgi:hypothetical protein
MLHCAGEEGDGWLTAIFAEWAVLCDVWPGRTG